MGMENKQGQNDRNVEMLLAPGSIAHKQGRQQQREDKDFL